LSIRESAMLTEVPAHDASARGTNDGEQAVTRRSNGDGLNQIRIAGGMLVLIVAVCFLGPLIGRLPGPNETGLTANPAPIGTSGHLLGTDDLGRDLLARALHGGQVSIEVAIGAVALGLLVGGTIGLIAGYHGGVIDQILSRVLDSFLALPALVLALAVAAYLGPNEHDVILAIAFFTVPGFGRVTRAAVLSLRQEDFIHATHALGARTPYILIRHVVPNVIGSILTFAIVTASATMLIEAGLSFLGAGIRPPEASWGNMIAEGQEFLAFAPHILLVPATFLFVAILSLNLLGDGVRRRYGL
jgi:peptide/nickel transport system permease protein